MNLKNKVVLVTGGAIGIGEAIVRAFSEQKALVIINYNRSKKEAEKLTKELQSKGAQVISVKADVSKEKDIFNLFETVIKKCGQIDILVNNASYSYGEDFVSGTRKVWQDQLTNNFLSVVGCSQQFLILNKGQKDKKIINISSIYGFGTVGDESFMQYCAAKSAVNNFTQNLAKFSAPILVNAIAPGYVWTPQWYKTDEKSKKTFAKKLAINRFIEPAEVADGVLFLAKNDAVTGVILPIDGGQTLISKD